MKADISEDLACYIRDYFFNHHNPNAFYREGIVEVNDLIKSIDFCLLIEEEHENYDEYFRTKEIEKELQSLIDSRDSKFRFFIKGDMNHPYNPFLIRILDLKGNEIEVFNNHKIEK